MIRAAMLGSACLGLVACATHAALQLPPPASATTEAAGSRLAQLGFGTQAHFAYCLSPLCPGVTPKLLPMVGTALPNAASSSSPPTPGGLRATILFANAQATLDAQAIQRLDVLLGAMPPSAHLVITGYTDGTGAQAINERLAHARAEATAAYLRRQATLSPDRTEIRAQGRCCYVAPNQTIEGRARNRRAEVVVTPLASLSR